MLGTPTRQGQPEPANVEAVRSLIDGWLLDDFQVVIDTSEMIDAAGMTSVTPRRLAWYAFLGWITREAGESVESGTVTFEAFDWIMSGRFPTVGSWFSRLYVGIRLGV
ncbi:MAG: hypothetical protein WED09_05345 [Homoserinimonas sp.]